MRSLNYKLIFLFLPFIYFQAYAGDWGAHVTQAQTLGNQLQALQNQIKELIVQKHHAHDPAQVQSLLQEMEKKQKEIKSKYPEYDKLRQHMKYQHPERGDQSHRKYLMFQEKSLDEIEAEVGLDGQLDRVQQKVKTVYQADVPPPPPPQPSVVPHADDTDGRPVLRK